MNEVKSIDINEISMSNAGNFRCCLKHFTDVVASMEQPYEDGLDSVLIGSFPVGHSIECPYCKSKNVLEDDGTFRPVLGEFPYRATDSANPEIALS